MSNTKPKYLYDDANSIGLPSEVKFQASNFLSFTTDFKCKIAAQLQILAAAGEKTGRVAICVICV